MLRKRTLHAALAAAITLLALAAPAAQAEQPSGPSADIIGGTPVADDSSYPYLAGILRNSSPVSGFYCGGSLIAPRWVLTAAHCKVDSAGYVPKYIVIGAADRSSGTGQVIPVTSYFQHPDWNPNTVQNDLMLAHLQFAPSGISPLPRAAAANDPPDGATVKLVGWGLTVTNSDGSDAPPLRANETTVETVANSSCAAAWAGVSTVISKQICAMHSTPTQHSACNGDSGGPMIYGGKQVGIVSYGVAGCTTQAPEVFTRVSSYGAWIDGAMAKSLAVSASDLEFGSVDVDGTATKTLTFTSDGDQAVTVGAATASGDFSVTSSTCSGLLPAGQSCQVDVSFKPTAGGDRYGKLSVDTDSVGTSTVTTALSGFGLGNYRKPVRMNLSRGRATSSGSKIKVAFKMDFKVPAGVVAATACKGKLGVKLTVAGRSYRSRSKVFVGKQSFGRVPRCVSHFTVKMARSALGRKAKVKLSLPANSVLLAKSSRTFSLRIR